MKTALLIFLMLLSAGAFAGDMASEQLIGHWQNTNAVKKFTTDLTFRRDGTFVGKITQEGKVAWEFGGKWSLKYQRLNYDYTASTLAKIPVGTKDQDEIVEITKEYFVCRGIIIRGEKKKYVRVE